MNAPFQLALFPRRKKDKSRKVIKENLVEEAETSQEKLRLLWLDIRKSFFPERHDLDSYTVEWSTRRQLRTLASCNLHERRIRVAKELRPTDYWPLLAPLLYHEMCHAFLGKSVGRDRRGRRWHGASFRRLERRHPQIPLLERWINEGGWHRAVRSARTRETWQRRQRS